MVQFMWQHDTHAVPQLFKNVQTLTVNLGLRDRHQTSPRWAGNDMKVLSLHLAAAIASHIVYAIGSLPPHEE